MSPYDYWKTTDIEGERRAEAGEWVETRANALMDDPDFLERVAEDDILEYGYEANARPIVELVADMIALHRVHPDDLPGSDLMARLYAHAKQLYQQAFIEAFDKAAAAELDTLPLAA